VDYRLLATTGLLALAACYTPPVTASCEVRCSTDGECPEGLTCNAADQFCHLPGDGAGDLCPPGGTVAELTGLAAGGNFTCGIDGDKQLWCWGGNNEGQIGTGHTERQIPIPGNVISAGVEGWRQVATGLSHACAIAEPSGALYCWGRDADGQLGDGSADIARNTPLEIEEPGPWDYVATGSYTTCAIKAGELWCWGQNYRGMLGDGNPGGIVDIPQRVGQDADWIAVDGSYSHTCGIRGSGDSGELWCWGDDDALGVDPPPVMPSVPQHVDHPQGLTWTHVSTGAFFTCAIDSMGSLLCWGNNDYWNLGRDGEVAPTPEIRDDSRDYTAVSAGDEHACAIAGNQLYCWGHSLVGETGTRIERVALQDPLPGMWKAVDAASHHTCAVDMENEVFCWGDNGDGQLGTGVAGDAYQPTLVDDREWSEVSAGPTGTCGITAGEIWCWGLGDEQIFGDVDDRTRPEVIGNVSLQTLSWRTVEVGAWHMCGITESEELWCWGHGDQGALGGGPTQVPNAPVRSNGAWTDVDVSYYYTCAITGQALYCFGLDNMGRTGDPAANGTVVTDHQVPGAFVDVALGHNYACGILSDGTMQCWGENRCNVVAPDQINEAVAPTPVPGTGWTSIELSFDDYQPFNVALAGANASSWGCDDSGRLGIGGAGDQTTPTPLMIDDGWTQVTAGRTFGCGLRGAGELYCWGNGEDGVLGGGTDLDVASPQRVGETSGWKKVAAGSKHMCAIAADDSLWCWGDNSQLQLGIALGMSAEPQAVVLPSE